MTIKAETEKKQKTTSWNNTKRDTTTQEPASCTTPAATATTLQAQQQRKTIMSRNEQWIATQLAKFPKGVFSRRKIVKRFEQFFCRQIKTKNAAIEHTKLNKHSRFIRQEEEEQEQAAWRKITRKSCNSCLLAKA